MAGLQGSGKTTTSGKLAQWLKKSGYRPMLVSVDVYRPAAREQPSHRSPRHRLPNLRRQSWTNRTLGTDAVLRLPPKKPSAKPPTTAATSSSSTPPAATRSTPLSRDEMAALKKLLNPSEILFVADAMTGQDAVNSARAFNDLLNITGSILTKMDKMPAAAQPFSIRHITGAPIKFLGTGEKPDAFEPFHPDRIVSRTRGHGDIKPPFSSAPNPPSTAVKPSSSAASPLRRRFLPRRGLPASSSVRSKKWAA